MKTHNDVSLFHSLVDETVKQDSDKGNKTGNKNETSSLKALANAVLERNTQRNKNETKHKPNVSLLCSSETKPPDDELIFYIDLYEERAAFHEYENNMDKVSAEWEAMNEVFIKYLLNTNTNVNSSEATQFINKMKKLTTFG